MRQPTSVERAFLDHVWHEYLRAMAKFPAEDNPVFGALIEEVGEISKALIEIPIGKAHYEDLLKELVQVGAMAIRLWLHGDKAYPGSGPNA